MPRRRDLQIHQLVYLTMNYVKQDLKKLVIELTIFDMKSSNLPNSAKKQIFKLKKKAFLLFYAK